MSGSYWLTTSIDSLFKSVCDTTKCLIDKIKEKIPIIKRLIEQKNYEAIYDKMLKTNAIKETFGVHAKKLSVSSTKSNMGHLLGAAGSVEAIFSILAIKNRELPATLNLDNPIESGNINLIPKEPINETIKIALSNSFGFGGTNAALIFEKV